jgi:hypothetical protein
MNCALGLRASCSRQGVSSRLCPLPLLLLLPRPLLPRPLLPRPLLPRPLLPRPLLPRPMRPLRSLLLNSLCSTFVASVCLHLSDRLRPRARSCRPSLPSLMGSTLVRVPVRCFSSRVALLTGACVVQAHSQTSSCRERPMQMLLLYVFVCAFVASLL